MEWDTVGRRKRGEHVVCSHTTPATHHLDGAVVAAFLVGVFVILAAEARERREDHVRDNAYRDGDDRGWVASETEVGGWGMGEERGSVVLF